MQATGLSLRRVLLTNTCRPSARHLVSPPPRVLHSSNFLLLPPPFQSQKRQFSSSKTAYFWPFTSSTPTTTTPPPLPPPTSTYAFDDAASSSSASSVAVPPPPPPPPAAPTPLPEHPPTPAAAPPTPVAAETVPDVPQFFLPGDPPIPTGSLDLTSLAGSFGPHPIQRFQSLFFNLHEYTHLPWWVLIPLVTVAIRLLLIPFFIRSQQNAARMAVIQPQLLIQMEKLKAAKASGDLPGMQSAQLGTQQLMQEHKVNPLKSIVFPLSQGVVFMCLFFALRGVAESGVDSLSAASEQLSWITDWGKADPLWVAPVLSSALTLAALETGVDKSTQVQTVTTRNMKTIFRALTVCLIPVMAYFPALIFLFWAPNNLLSLTQSLIFRIPGVRAFFNIPTPPKKKEIGEVGYVREPGFMEAFREMQVGVRDKWEDQKAAAEAATQAEKERTRPQEVRYRPINVVAPSAPEPKRRVLEEIVAEPLGEEEGDLVGQIEKGRSGAGKEGKAGREDRLKAARERRAKKN